MVMQSPCKVCGNILQNEIFRIREMQLGLRELFTYQLCGNCGCMQLQDIPSDLSLYYPGNKYYSFNAALNVRSAPDPLRRIRTSYLVFGKNKVPGMILSVGYKVPDYIEWLKAPCVQFQDKILDVGTGNGSLLIDLFKNGYVNLKGIDPFIDQDLNHKSINILKKDIFQIDGLYDFIMLNHVFEHMDEPLNVLNRLYELIRPGKYVLIRTPIMGNYLWNEYRENWMQLDAPRHLFIHSEKSLRLLFDHAGFILKKVVYDSTASTIIGSEQYKNDIPLMDDSSYLRKKNDSFSRKKIKELEQLVVWLNQNKQGDQAAFYLQKSI